MRYASHAHPHSRAAGTLLALLLLISHSAKIASAQESPPPAGMGRLYVFRGLRTFGAHIEDYVTLDGTPVQRISPGGGFYCDVAPGTYSISVSPTKANIATVPVAAGQSQYVSVSLRESGGMSPRCGPSGMGQSFDVRLLEPAYGARRVSEYRLAKGTCSPVGAAK